MQYRLSKESTGHCLHHTKCFSLNDEWIVYDSRNTDSSIGCSGSISIMNSVSGDTRKVYEAKNQTAYGPGVGAASFSPKKNDIIFIHGLRNSSRKAPYAFNRRSAAMINIDRPDHFYLLDARNIVSPYTTGALRGGTHSHLWDEKGDWISFTYDDYIMDELSARLQKNIFKRTVGIMIPDHQVIIDDELRDYENHSGEMFSFIVAKTTPFPKKGSDEIDTAFDETWVGNNGYVKPDGSRQRKAIAFQGNVTDKSGATKTEIFIVDLPESFKKADFKNTKGTEQTPPVPPKKIIQRRISFTENGIHAPRHWLRSLPDGSKILFLNKDSSGIVQLYSINTNRGIPIQITRHKSHIEGPFNISPDGKFAAYICQNEVVVTSLTVEKSIFISAPQGIRSRAIGAVVWSNSGDRLVYNRFIMENAEEHLHIFIIELNK